MPYFIASSVPPDASKSYRSLADYRGVPYTTLYYRNRGHHSIEEKKEKVLVKFLLQMSDLRQPMRIKYIPSLAFVIAHKRPKTRQPLK
ncbi:hypothetical protein GGP41_001014 [Bipolaris sorokiniana]|uniref:Uncharacterized protein n=1 Tax=Cochliobolus sativus TaxID=45130 RepID=A0A8H6DYE0_COCSA|nr:hypothetical protein GGP41_001014 [Bipolaris sorokiniana]